MLKVYGSLGYSRRERYFFPSFSVDIVLPSSTLEVDPLGGECPDPGLARSAHSCSLPPCSRHSRSSPAADHPTTPAQAAGGGGKVTLVAYSTPQEAYEKIIPAFQKTPDGKGVKFDQSYGASGEQSPRRGGRAAGRRRGVLPRSPTWTGSWTPTSWTPTGPTTSTRAWSPTRWWSSRCARATPRASRRGTTCIKPGVEVITPNPFTSGGAKWNIMAAYGAQLKQGKSRGPGQGLPREAVRPRAGAGQERPRGPADVHRRARATCCSPTRTRPSPPSRRARTSTTSCPTRRS